MNNSAFSKASILSIFVMLLIGGISYAQLPSSASLSAFTIQVSQQSLNAAYAYAGCRVNFTTSMVTQILSDDPNLTALNAQTAVITNDYSQLGNYVQADNATNFRMYLAGTFNPQFNSASKNITLTLKSANLPSNTIALIRSQYNTTLVTLSNCEFTTIQNFANAKLGDYKSTVLHYGRIAANASNRGIDVSQITQVLNGANTSVINPLQTAITNAKNASAVHSALGQYCLYNDCANGYNYHFEVKIALSVFDVAFSRLQNYPNVTSQQNITAVENYISSAQSELNVVGNNTYTAGQEQIIYGNLSSAMNLTRFILSHAKVHIGGKNRTSGI